MRRTALLLGFLLMNSCGVPDRPLGVDDLRTRSSLVGQWRLVRVGTGGTVSPALVDFSVVFEPDAEVSGMAGPNYWGGRFEVTGPGEIEFNGLFSTEIGGPDAVRGAEHLMVLARTRWFLITDSGLLLETGQGEFMRFRRFE